MRRKIVTVVMVFALAVPFLFLNVLPDIGDPTSAPNSHVSDYYIENTIETCNSPNMVTSVIVDFRAFDTLFETTVMFLSGLCVIMLLSRKPDMPLKHQKMVNGFKRRKYFGKPVYRTINKDVMIAIIEPLILIYAIYVLFHGEVSLGGGFQAGALIAMVYLLDTMVGRRDRDLMIFDKYKAARIAGLGPFIYAFAGILTMIGGGLFLEYDKFPLPLDAQELHSIGILIVEIGVTIGVMCTIITILDAILERVSFDDDVH